MTEKLVAQNHKIKIEEKHNLCQSCVHRPVVFFCLFSDNWSQETLWLHEIKAELLNYS